MFTTTAPTAPSEREPELLGQTVVVIGGSAGVGPETARRARAAGADVVLNGRDPDEAAVERFFDGLPGPIDHVVVAAGGSHDSDSERIVLAVARNAVAKMRPGGTLLLEEGTVSPPFMTAMAAALAPVRVRVKLVGPALADGGLLVLARAA